MVASRREEAIAEHHAAIIFVTAHDEFALRTERSYATKALIRE
jgi:DNA-binding LytR/AlgR family response regulator